MRFLVVVGILVSLVAPTCYAACPSAPRLICAEYFNSAAVVEAKLARTSHIVPTDEQDGYVYAMETTKVLRGNTASEFEIYEENSSSRASFDWVPGRTYLLFLIRPPNGKRYLVDG